MTSQRCGLKQNNTKCADGEIALRQIGSFDRRLTSRFVVRENTAGS
jgi:hypothetical protein